MHRHGFTLLEMAIALLVTGLVAITALQLTQTSNSAECYATTKTQINTLKDAVERFALKNDRFPLPARRNVGVESPSYGREVLPANITDLDQVGGAVFGAIPFQALGIPVDNASDCWGNKYTYVVTRDLTDSSLFLTPSTDGAIDIKTNIADATPFLTGAGYAIISHGEDQLGAVKNNYSTSTNALADRKWCTDDTTKKSQNCALVATKIASEFNDGKNAAGAYFDDIVVYRGKPWRIGMSDPDGGRIYCWAYAWDMFGSPQYTGSFLNFTTTPAAPTKFLKASGVPLCALGVNNRIYCKNTMPTPDIMLDTSTISGHGALKNIWGAVWDISHERELLATMGDGTMYHASIGLPTGAVSVQPFSALTANAHTNVDLRYQDPGADSHSCYVTSTGSASCTDRVSGVAGPIGFGFMDEVPAGTTFNAVSMGEGSACAAGNDGNLYCRGDNTQGQLGIGSNANDADFTIDHKVHKPAGVTDFITAALKKWTACALSDDGNIYCWGSGFSNAPNAVSYAKQPGVTNYIALSDGSCALSDTGHIYCWNKDVALPMMEMPMPAGVTSFASFIPNSSCAIEGTPPPFNGGWTPWTACSGACGGGAGTQTRTCSLGAGLCGTDDTRACVNNDACPTPIICDGSDGASCTPEVIACSGSGSGTATWTCSIGVSVSYCGRNVLNDYVNCP